MGCRNSIEIDRSYIIKKATLVQNATELLDRRYQQHSLKLTQQDIELPGHLDYSL